jgi:sugar/nucleoside kinase (ribokinase family)
VIVCLGEALVDLICERAVRSFADADSFKPHFGGALANVAVVAGLAERGWDSARASEAVGPALEAAPEACTRWAALA